MDDHLIRFQKKKFLFLDFETFNLALHDSINLPWQVATILIETRENENGRICNHEISRNDIYLKWNSDLKIGKGARQITGYTAVSYTHLTLPTKRIV